jgi:hypothetical protein
VFCSPLLNAVAAALSQGSLKVKGRRARVPAPRIKVKGDTSFVAWDKQVPFGFAQGRLLRSLGPGSE